MAISMDASNSQSMIGAYGSWAASLSGDDPLAYSFRRDEWTVLKIGYEP